MKNSIKKIIAMMLVGASISMTGCSSKNEEPKERKLVIATQVGLSHSGTILMNELGILKECLPEDVDVELKEITGGGAAVREALSTNEVNIGGMGIPPYLIGKDKDLDLTLLSGLAVNPYVLVSNTDRIKTIEDISENDKIALLQFGSIQHIMLSSIAEKEFGDSKKFENNIVTMPENDSIASLEAGKEVSVYLGPQPVVQKAIDLENTNVIANVSDYIGNVTSVVAVANSKYYKENKDICDAYNQALQKTFEYMNENPDECIKILAAKFNMDEEYFANIYKQVIFSKDIYGFDDIADFMYRNSYLTSKPKTLNEDMNN